MKSDATAVRFMLTAGHTFMKNGSLVGSTGVEVGRWTARPNTDATACSMPVAGRKRIGEFKPGETFFDALSGGLVDVAVVSVDESLPPEIVQPPWTLPVSSVVPVEELRNLWNAGKQPLFHLHAASGLKLVLLDSIAPEEAGRPTVLLQTTEGPVWYAETLIHCRPVGPGDATIGGDSGAPLLTQDGKRLVGFHILGDGETSYAVAADSVLRHLRVNFGRRLAPTGLS